MEDTLAVLTFHRWRHWGLERLSCLTKDTLCLSGEPWFRLEQLPLEPMLLFALIHSSISGSMNHVPPASPSQGTPVKYRFSDARAGRLPEMWGNEFLFFFRALRLWTTALCSNILSKTDLPHLYKYQVIEKIQAPAVYICRSCHIVLIPFTSISSEIFKNIVPFLVNFKLFMCWIYTKGTLSLFK